MQSRDGKARTMRVPAAVACLFFGLANAAWRVTALWPIPTEVSSGETSLQVIPSASFFQAASVSGLADVETLSDAFARYNSLTFPHPASSSNGPSYSDDAVSSTTTTRRLRSLSAQMQLGGNEAKSKLTGMIIKVQDASEEYPQLDTDESYTLKIDTQHGNVGYITAQTIYGALRGLETFSQIVVFDFETASYEIEEGFGAPLSIHDGPRFPHRGLMIDTARHFLPLSAIKDTVDSMSYAKLNVLHWHISDTQSFPLQFDSRPKLWMASHSLRERYLKDEVRSIVEYARKRGIRVIPELDVPGHAASWCIGYPEVCPSDPNCRQPLNVANNETFDLINDLIVEAVNGTGDSSDPIFRDSFFHLGGDEVDTTCWENDTTISAWLRNNSYSPDEGYAYFVKRAASLVINQNRRPVQWSEVYDHFKKKLDPSTIVHVWKGVTNVSEVAEAGYNLIVNVGYSDGSWYLDNLGYAWDNVYDRDPCRGIPDERTDLCSKVLGGHGEMWGETVDASDLAATVWPRLASIAEKLWSTKEHTRNASVALPRIQAFRCLLNERGISAAPVLNAEARSAPPGPGSCFDQRRRRQSR